LPCSISCTSSSAARRSDEAKKKWKSDDIRVRLARRKPPQIHSIPRAKTLQHVASLDRASRAEKRKLP